MVVGLIQSKLGGGSLMVGVTMGASSTSWVDDGARKVYWLNSTSYSTLVWRKPGTRIFATRKIKYHHKSARNTDQIILTKLLHRQF